MYKYIAAGAVLVTTIVTVKFLRRLRIRLYSAIFMEEPPLEWAPPSRDAMSEKLKTTEFDLVIIGGGSSGAGCALDAATRGLSVALVEASDFGAETSCKSTKLIHGGIRYLAKAVTNLDWSQLKLVCQALRERTIIFNISPYLTNSIPLILPIYSKILLPYYLIGLKLYDWFSGFRSLGKSRFITKQETVEAFPRISQKDLCGGVVYFDGQQDDARNNVMLVITAVYHGAVAQNHTEVTSLVVQDRRVVGVKCRDMLTQESFEVRAKGVINTTGPFTDEVRRMQGSEPEEIMTHSSGTHIILPSDFTPKGMGFVDPGTRDGRVAFFMPWMGKTVVGSTDKKCRLERLPIPKEDEVDFLIHEAQVYTSHTEKLSRRDVLAAWTGVRPLVRDTRAGSTEALVRRHVIELSKEGLLTATGGKWTTYRIMAMETIDKAIWAFKLRPRRPCVTENVKILGGHKYTKELYMRLQQELGVFEEVARHLSRAYGTRALNLKRYIEKDPSRLSEKHPHLRAEIEYCIDHEMAVAVGDVLCGRLMIGLVDVREAEKCIRPCLDVFSEKFKWDAGRRDMEEASAVEMLNGFGLGVLSKIQ
jgi:glycerol-3-phosphate dehydrogenase